MKKLPFCVVVALVFLLSISGCQNKSDGSGLVEIRENMFISQIDEINLNYSDYLGRTIKLEGLLKALHWEGNNYYFVIRNAPGCCGDDGEVGFEVSWNPEYRGPRDNDYDGEGSYPDPFDWVEATGELRSYDFYGMTFLYLALSELNALETRGEEFVVR